jgi:hypothetical protein
VSGIRRYRREDGRSCRPTEALRGGTLSSWQPRVAPCTSNSTRGLCLARAEAHDANRPDDEIIEDALSRYLLERLLDKTQGRANLTEEEATRVAVEELHAVRRERDAAA